MSWLLGQASSEWEAAAKAALMYATALLALRAGERRTLAQWMIIDFATAVAMGAIIGRTAIAGTQSYVAVAVAVCTLVAIHRFASLLRFRPLGKLLDHRVRVLVADGKLRPDELRKCGGLEHAAGHRGGGPPGRLPRRLIRVPAHDLGGDHADR